MTRTMEPEPVTLRAEGQVQNKKHEDEFNMAKLRKSLKQEQQQALKMKDKTAKLTPAEIRSLNQHSPISTLRPGSSRSGIDRSAAHAMMATPPLTPDQQSPTKFANHRMHKIRTEIPTPPISPDRTRRDSSSSARRAQLPQPTSFVQNSYVSNTSTPVRPASQISYRGVATSLDSDMTRTNSVTVMHASSQQILSNPLSQFSRPRQSAVLASSKRNSVDLSADNEIIAPVARKPQRDAPKLVSQASLRGQSPLRVSDSPVSVEDDNARRLGSLGSVKNGRVSPLLAGNSTTRDQIDVENKAEPTKKQRLGWRKTFTAPAGNMIDSDIVPLHKEQRRRTFMTSKNNQNLQAVKYDDTRPGEPPVPRATLKDELPSTKSAGYQKQKPNAAETSTTYAQHPAIRPLNDESSEGGDLATAMKSRDKGKGKEIDTGNNEDEAAHTSTSPSSLSYSQCSCCGRVQRNCCFESDLSPVLENENLRTNIDLEIDRASNNHSRKREPSIHSSHGKYVPILPMVIGTETKQATFVPQSSKASSIRVPTSPPPTIIKAVAINKPGDIIAPGSTPLAIMPKSRQAPKFTRFASLHFRKEEVVEVQKIVAEKQQPPAPPQRFGSLYGIKADPRHSGNLQPVQQPRQSQTQSTYSPLRSSPLSIAQETSGAVMQIEPTTETGGTERAPTGATNEATTPTSPALSTGMVDAGVDLSSFDGSFVQGSISRTATIHEPSQAHMSSEGPADVKEGITKHTAVKSESEQMPNARTDGRVPDKHSAETSVQDHDGSSKRSSTVVRMIPSSPIPRSETPSSGPPKLGDWILPDSPQSLSTGGSGRSSQMTGIAL